MKDQHTSIPIELLGPSTSMPEVRTIVAEVRSDAALPFDPKDGPPHLVIAGSSFGALIIWYVDVSWSKAQQIQLWLKSAPAGGLFPTREEALKDFVENIAAGTPPGPFLEYVGTYLATGVSHGSYTLILGYKRPVPRDEYQTAFLTALNAVIGGAPAWGGELLEFLKMMLNDPTSREDFLTLATSIGDLSGASLIGKFL